MKFKELFFFNNMLVPKLITIIYWLSIGASTFTGLASIFNGYRVTFGKLCTGIALALAGIVISRIYCELLIVIFKIHENLKKLADAKDEVKPEESVRKVDANDLVEA